MAKQLQDHFSSYFQGNVFAGTGLFVCLLSQTTQKFMSSLEFSGGVGGFFLKFISHLLAL